MSLNVIRLGLTDCASDEYIKKISNMDSRKKVVLVVPDQYSFDAEKLFCKHFGGTGLNGRHVMTFHQMSRQLLNIDKKRYLLPSGKKMLLKFSINSAVDEKSMFFTSSRSNGFLETLENLLSEFKRYSVLPKMLFDAVKNEENKVLKDKIETLASVYEEYEKRLKTGGFLDSEDDLVRVSDAILNDGFFNDSYVVFDSFTDFSPKHFKIIESILKSGADVDIFINASKEPVIGDGSLWEFPEKTVKKLAELSKKVNVSYKETLGECKRKMSPAILSYAENFENTDYKFNESADEIRVFQAKEKYGEIEHTALLISDLVREYGYKYSDIAVVCSDIEEYLSFIEPKFLEYHIPYFSDHKVLMTEHPVAVLIMSVFDILENNFTKDDCMRYIRTGFVIPDSDADMLENHILKRGIRGNMWQNSEYFLNESKKVFDDITGTDLKNISNTYMEELRLKIVTPLINLKEKTKGRKTIREMCVSLFEFINETELYEKTQAKIKKLSQEGFQSDALRYERVWNFMVEIIEQAVITSGDEKVLRKEFCELILASMSGCEMDIIPTLADGVLVMGTDAGVPSGVKALFVLGANQNEFPKLSREEGILSDAERELLSIKDIELAPSVKEKSLQTEFKTVRLLTSASDILNISFPTSDINGETKEPSQIIFDLLDMFPKLRKSNDFVEDKDFLYISSPEATIHKLLLKMADTDGINTLWEKVKNWYMRREEFSDKLKLIDTVLEFKQYSASLRGENARLLYEDYDNYSISRIERYFECPFKYFLENGLKLKEREEWEISPADTGSLLHWAAAEYCKRVDNDAKSPDDKKNNWDKLTDDDSKKIIDDILEGAENQLGILEYDREKTQNVLIKIKDALIKSVPIINLSMKNGKYVGAAYEVEFSGRELKNALGTVKIKGIIDRVDIYEDFDEGKAYIRVIDYKSGSKSFSLERVLNRVDLQLMVYAIAASSMYKSGEFDGFSGELTPEVKGVFYDKLKNTLVECDFKDTDSIENLKIMEAKLDGVLFTRELGEKSKTYLDAKDAEDMDYEIKETGASRFLKIVKKEKGEGLNKRSSSAESDELRDAVLKHVKDGLIDADCSIKSGDIEVSPYKASSAKESACRYCPYASVCAFDREKSPCRKRERTKKEITDEILGKKV